MQTALLDLISSLKQMREDAIQSMVPNFEPATFRDATIETWWMNGGHYLFKQAAEQYPLESIYEEVDKILPNVSRLIHMILELEK